MNNIYKVIWSKAKNCYVVASEIARSHTKSASGSEKIGGVTRRSLLASLMALSLLCGGLGVASAADVVKVEESTTSTTEVYTKDGTQSYVESKLGDYYTKTGVDEKIEALTTTGDVATNKNNIAELQRKTQKIDYDVASEATNVNGMKVGQQVDMGGKNITNVGTINGIALGEKESGDFISQDGSIWGNMKNVDAQVGKNLVAIGENKEAITALDTKLDTKVGTVGTGEYLDPIKSIGENLGRLDAGLKKEVDDRTAADNDLSNRIGTVTDDGEYIKKSATNNVSENLKVLDGELAKTNDRTGGITRNADDTQTTIEGKVTVDKDGNVGGVKDLTVDGKLNVGEIYLENNKLESTGKKHDSATSITADGISNRAKVTDEKGNTTESKFTHNEKGTFNYARDEKFTGEWKGSTSNVTADGLSNKMTDSDGNTHTYYQTATETKEQLVNGDKSKSNFEKKTAEGNTISIKDKDAAGNPKSLTNKQTVDGEKTSVTNNESFSTINQGADQIRHNVTSADGKKSSIEVKAEGITNTSKDGTITNEAKDIVNNATGNMTNTVGGQLTTTVTGQATENFNGGLDTNVTGKENHTVTGDQDIHVTGKQTNNIEGNQENTIGGDQTTTVKGNAKEDYQKDLTTNVGGNELHEVKGTKTENVTGMVKENYSNGQETNVTGNQDIYVSENQTNEIGGDQENTIGGDQTTTVEGNVKEDYKNDLTTNVGGNELHEVKGTKTENVTGMVKENYSNGQETNVTGNQDIYVSENQTNTIDGDQENTIGGDQTTTVTGDISNKADNITNEAKTKLTDKVGENTRVIESRSITDTVGAANRKIEDGKITDNAGDSTVTTEKDKGTTFTKTGSTAYREGGPTDTNISGNTITTGKVNMDYAEVMKDLGVHGNAKVDNNLEVGGTLDVTQRATFHDAVDITKDLSVGGNATIRGDVTAKSYKVGDKTYIDANGINANNQKITNVADGSISEGSKDAVNGGQLYGVKRDLEHQVDKVGANAAAMANLRPMEFDPSSKWNIAAAIGNYGSETAAALGAFYRPNDNVMVNLSTAFGTGENMVGGGVSVRLGKGGNKLSREETNALKAQVADLTARMDALLSVLNPNMSKDFPDVPENHWAYEAVSRLAGNDIVQGYPDGEFHGERTMTRYEMAEIIYNALSRGAEAERELVEEFKPELQAMAASEKATAEKTEG